jgi:hypothetical protein
VGIVAGCSGRLDVAATTELRQGGSAWRALSLADTQRSSLALCSTGKQQPPQDPHSHPDRAKMKVAPRLWFCLLSRTRTTHVAQRNSFPHD